MQKEKASWQILRFRVRALGSVFDPANTGVQIMNQSYGRNGDCPEVLGLDF